MKLHLNLALRRALMAAMAMVTLHTAEADLNTKYNGPDAYITGTGTLTESTWNEVWNKRKASTLTIGSYEGTAEATLSGSTYNKGQIIFVAGTGHNSGVATANNGTLNITSGAKVNTSTLHVGLSLKQCTGTLNITSSTLNTGSEFTVGGYAGTGIVTADKSTITVDTDKDGGVFRVGYHNGKAQVAGSVDTITLTNSTITVGAKGGAKDTTSIGHEAGTSELNLDGSTATFYDQTIVGELGATGTIHVHNKSTLNMDDAVLGYSKGATGTICVEDSKVSASKLILGDSGTGIIELEGNSASVTADSIELGAAAGSTGSIKAGSGTITTDLLSIGSVGKGSVISSATIKAADIVIGETATGSGSLVSEGSVEADKLYVGYKGTGTANVNGGTLNAKEAYIVGTNSELNTTNGTTTLSKATVLAGKLSTAATGTTKVTGELILDEAGQLVNSGVTTLNSASVMSGASILANGGTLSASTLVNGGTITTEQGGKLVASSLDNSSIITNGGELSSAALTNKGTISNTGTWTATGETVSTAGTINNDGALSVRGKMTTGTVTGTGTTTVATGGTWNITDQTTQGTIASSGTTTITGAGFVDAETLTGGATIKVDADRITSTAAVIELGNATDAAVKVAIDVTDPNALLSKTVNFLEVADSLVGLNQETAFTLLTNEETKEAEFAWNENSIDYDKELRGDVFVTKKLHFTQSAGSTDGLTTGMTFTGTSISKGEIVESLNAAETELAKAEDKKEEVAKVETTEVVNGKEIAVTTTTTTTTTTKIAKPEEGKASVIAATDNVVTSAVVGVATETEKTNVILGKNVENIGNGNVQAQMISIDRIDEDGKIENIKVSGVSLVFSGEVHQVGAGDAYLGFEEGSKGAIDKTIETAIETTKDGKTETSTETKEVKEEVRLVDVIRVEKEAQVTLTGMKVHSTHALTVAGNEQGRAKLNLANVTMHVGGTDDHDLFETYEYTDENGKKVKGEVETDHHITVHSKIEHADIDMSNGTALSFEKVYDTAHGGEVGSAVFENCVITQTADTKLGSEDEHMDTIELTNTTVKGTGEMRNFKMKGKHSKLIAGNSPGIKTLSSGELEDGEVGVYFITGNSAKWNFSGSNADYRNTLSAFSIDKQVSLTGVTVSVAYETLDEDGQYVTSDSTSLNYKFQDGASITLFENCENLTGTYTFNEASLPLLSEEFEWDTEKLLDTGKIYVVLSEVLEEPTRIANTLVSAGETTLNFGRLAQNQATLREAGTTRTWGSAIAMFDSIDSGSTTNGYDYSNWGAAVGVDHAFTKNTVVGVAFGCTWGENEPEIGTDHYAAGSIDQDAKMIGIYGVHKFQTKGLLNDVKLSAFAAYGMFENDSTRTNLKNGHNATAEWDSDAWVLSASLSRDITTDSGVVFTPYVGVEYTTAGMDDFSEQGKSYSADYSADKDYSNLSVKVGMTVSKTMGSFTPYASVAYISDVDRTAGKVTATGRDTITGKSALPGRNGFELGVGATWQLTDNLDVNAGYSAEIRDKATEQNARVGIGYTF